MVTKVEWIESAGGPLLLAPRTSVKDWFGSTVRSGSSQTDYERACAIADEIGTVSIGDRSAIVLGDEPDRTALLPHGPPGSLYIVRWRWAASEESLLSALFKEGALQTLSFVGNEWIATSDEEYWLFDSAYPGSRIETYLQVKLETGRYFIGTASFNPNPNTSALIHSLILSTGR